MSTLTIAGNLTATPELRNVNGGRTIVSFSLAENRRWTDKATGATQEAVTYLDVAAWGVMAEHVAKNLGTGGLLSRGAIFVVKPPGDVRGRDAPDSCGTRSSSTVPRACRVGAPRVAWTRSSRPPSRGSGNRKPCSRSGRWPRRPSCARRLGPRPRRASLAP